MPSVYCYTAVCMSYFFIRFHGVFHMNLKRIVRDQYSTSFTHHRRIPFPSPNQKCSKHWREQSVFVLPSSTTGLLTEELLLLLRRLSDVSATMSVQSVCWLSQESRYSKMEKADILEMTVAHLKFVHSARRSTYRDSSRAGCRTAEVLPAVTGSLSEETSSGAAALRYLMGYNECVREVASYLAGDDGETAGRLGDDVRIALMRHLAFAERSVRRADCDRGSVEPGGRRLGRCDSLATPLRQRGLQRRQQPGASRRTGHRSWSTVAAGINDEDERTNQDVDDDLLCLAAAAAATYTGGDAVRSLAAVVMTTSSDNASTTERYSSSLLTTWCLLTVFGTSLCFRVTVPNALWNVCLYLSDWRWRLTLFMYSSQIHIL